MSIRVFEGYSGLFYDFWEFTARDMIELHGCSSVELDRAIGDFYTKPIVMVDDVGILEYVGLSNHSGRDLHLNTCLDVPCLDLVGEGYTSRLFLLSDLERLIAASNGAILYEHFLQEVES